MRCKACNKIMDTPANWLNPDKVEDDMCAACVKSSEMDWDTQYYAFGKAPVNGLTLPPPDSEETMFMYRNIHGLQEFTP